MSNCFVRAQQAIAMSGKQQFPFMIDPNNNNRCG